jgi:hypothetical protein
MPKTYTVGRSSSAEIRTPKKFDAVGKVHCELTDLGNGKVQITDLKSTNGTFVREGEKWVEIKGKRTLDVDAEIMLADFCSTPRDLLAEVPTTPAPPSAPGKKVETEKKTTPAPPPLPSAPARKPRLRRNEFGEIVQD